MVMMPNNPGRAPILYIENGRHGGGAAESLYQLIKNLDRKAFSPAVLFANHSRYVERIAQLDVPANVLVSVMLGREGRARNFAAGLAGKAMQYSSMFSESAAIALEKMFFHYLEKRTFFAIQAYGARLVHTNNNPHRDFYAIRAAANAGSKCVCHIRSFHTMGFTRTKARLANAHVSRFIAYSRSVAEHWIDHGVDPEKTTVVHNAIEPLQVEPLDLHKDFGLPRDDSTIGIIGRVIPERGHELLFQAFAEALRSLPNLRLLVVGGADPGDFKRLDRLAHELGIHDRVVFAGYRKDAQAIMAALQCVVLPYTIEPFGRTVLEAWQLGVPVIVSDVGHIHEIVQHGENGLTFTARDASSLARRMIDLLSDSELAGRLIRNGADTCSRSFSDQTYAHAIMDVYREILSHKDSPGA